MKNQKAALAAFLLILFALVGCRAAPQADSLPAAADHEEGTDSWVILRIGDESFYCDPESEMNMRAHSQPWNLYKIPRAKLAGIGYREPEKDAE